MPKRTRTYASFFGIASLVVLALIAIRSFMERIGQPSGESNGVAIVKDVDEPNFPGTDEWGINDEEFAQSYAGTEALNPILSMVDSGALDFIATGLTEEWIEYEKLSGDMLWPEIPMRLEVVIWRAFQMASTNRGVDIESRAFAMLDSDNEFVRLTGALWLLEKNQALDVSIQDRLIADEASFVPLSAIGWMMDRGMNDAASNFAARWKNNPDIWNRALAEVAEGELNGLALRAGLKLIGQSDLPAEEKLSAMNQVAANQYAAYDARWQAVMMLRRQMDFVDYQRLVNSFIKPINSDDLQPRNSDFPDNPQDEAFQTAMRLLDARIAGPPELMSQAPVLTKDDADLLFAEETSLMFENVAFWLEAAVDQGIAKASPEFYAALTGYLRDVPRDELPANQLLSLMRVEVKIIPH